jgi:MFS family permease
LFFAAQFFQTGRGDKPLAAGLHLLAWTASVTVEAPLAGKLVNRVGARPLAAVGLALQAAGMVWLALIATPSVPYWEMIAPMLVAGAGVSMAMPAAQIQQSRELCEPGRLHRRVRLVDRCQWRAVAGRGIGGAGHTGSPDHPGADAHPTGAHLEPVIR